MEAGGSCRICRERVFHAYRGRWQGPFLVFSACFIVVVAVVVADDDEAVAVMAVIGDSPVSIDSLDTMHSSSSVLW